jgi:hypothetical protein
MRYEIACVEAALAAEKFLQKRTQTALKRKGFIRKTKPKRSQFGPKTKPISVKSGNNGA